MKTLIRSGLRVLLGSFALLLASWSYFFLVVAPGEYDAGATAFDVGFAFTAFMLGVRHAFDPDHIAAIDNTTRKLISDEKDASSVGTWFALGHSSIVVMAVGLVTAGLGGFTEQMSDEGSSLRAFADVWGPSVSSIVLLILAAVNLTILLAAVRPPRRGGRRSDQRPAGGVGTRLILRVGAVIDRPWKMYLVGLMFGLGFDTASTITLLLIAGGAGVIMPWYAAMVFPLLFAAGMVACDGVNSILMARAYAWTTDRPDHRLPYNVTLISISVAVATIVGLVGLSGVLVETLGLYWPPLVLAASVDLDNFGFLVVGALITAWITSWLVARRCSRVVAVSGG